MTEVPGRGGRPIFPTRPKLSSRIVALNFLVTVSSVNQFKTSYHRIDPTHRCDAERSTKPRDLAIHPARRFFD
jgi:hypothetical protein